MLSIQRTRARSVRLLLLPLFAAVAAVLLAHASARAALAQPVQGREAGESKVVDFVDKWLINGGNVGGAIGAVAGQMLMQAVLPGPAALFAGSFVGNQIGQLVGEYADNKVGKAYNYVAFNRPALGEPGSVYLENAGPYEQTFYQIDRWAISGGTMASLATHYALNILARRIPGAGHLASPLFLLIADYVAGSIGDNLDGLIDLSQLGKRIDRAKGLSPRPVAVLEVPGITPGGPVSRSSDRAGASGAYSELVAAIKSQDRERARTAHERYQKVIERKTPAVASDRNR